MLDHRRIVAFVLPVLLLVGLATAPAQPVAAAATALSCVEYLVGALICSTPDAAPAGLRYTTYDPTGQATTPGSYAFLDAAGDVVTTYEGLRDRTTTGLRIHTSDADGASQAAVYDGIAVGDVVEWRKSEDCWVRYEVMEVKADPAPRKVFAIKWTAYARTGCTGTVAPDSAVSVTVDPPSFFDPTITSPVRYGPFQLIPLNWDGALEAGSEVTQSSAAASRTSGSSEAPADSEAPAWASGDPAVAHLHPLWNEPALPEGWTLDGFSAQDWFIKARYSDDEGYWAATTWIARQDWSPRDLAVGYTGLEDYVEEVRTIDGHPAYLHSYIDGSAVHIYDETTGVEYFAHLFASSGDPDGRGIDDAIAIARSLYQ